MCQRPEGDAPAAQEMKVILQGVAVAFHVDLGLLQE
jgi:hypothetical protein